MEKRGQINEYLCKSCDKLSHTINLSNGTTPFGIICPHCKSTECFSGFYRLSKLPVVIEAFYRPAKLPENVEEQNFVIRGALLHAPLMEACAKVMQDDPIQMDTDGESYARFIACKWGITQREVLKAMDPYGEAEV